MEPFAIGPGGPFPFLISVISWALILLWGVVLGLYIYYLKRWGSCGPTVQILLFVLAVDAVRTLVESGHFGIHAQTLARPELVLVPKAINVFSALLITLILVMRWVPAFLRQRSEQEEQIKQLEREVDRRKRAEVALAQAFLKHDTLLQAIPDIVFMTDARGRLQRWNRTGEEETGKEAEQLQGRLALRVIERADRAAAAELFKQCKERGEAEFEARLLGANGRCVPYLWKGVARHDLEGRFAGVTGIGRDLTARKRFEQTLQDERNFIASVLETIATLVVVVDCEGRITRFNKACERRSGYSFEEVRGEPIWERLFAVPESEFVKKVVTEMVATGRPQTCETHWIGKDGRRRLIAWDNTALANASGEENYVICTGIDITEQRHAEQSLRQRLMAEQALSEFSSRFVATSDFSRALREVMNDLARLTRTSCICVVEHHEESASKMLYRGQPHTGQATCLLGSVQQQGWLDRLRSGEIVVFDEGERCPPDELATVPCFVEGGGAHSLLVPLFVSDEFFGWIGLRGMQSYRIWCDADYALLRLLARVVSGALLRKAVNEQNERLISENRRLARRALAIQEEERAHLARELHDELGQSITAIRADAESICRWSGERHSEIHASARAIAEVSDGVYALVKDMMGRLRPAMLDELGLAVALNECVAEWNRRYPAVRCELVIKGDAARLGGTTCIVAYRVVQESLTNVARHAMAHHVEVHVSLQNSAVRSTLEVVVCDDGVGMDVEKLPRGLGLLGMRERVLGIGGRFDIHSEPGTGATVRALLPVSVG